MNTMFGNISGLLVVAIFVCVAGYMAVNGEPCLALVTLWVLSSLNIKIRINTL